MPIRSYGKLNRTPEGQLHFRYRPWLFLPQRTLELPEGDYAVGRGLIYPNISLIEDDDLRATLVCPPRYRTHEAELSDAYQLSGVREVGLRKGLTAIRDLFTGQQKPEPAIS